MIFAAPCWWSRLSAPQVPRAKTPLVAPASNSGVAKVLLSQRIVPFRLSVYLDLRSIKRITRDVAVRSGRVHDQVTCSIIGRGVERMEREFFERDTRARFEALLRLSAERGWHFVSSELFPVGIFEAAGLSLEAAPSSDLH